jgi:NAD+ diphosphatase
MSAPIAFAGGTLDRAAHLRGDHDYAHLRTSPDATALLVGADQNIALTSEGTLAHIPIADLPAGAPLTFLGLEPSGAPVFAADLLDLRSITPDHPLSSLRELMAELKPDAAALAAYAVGMVSWHRVHRHCGRCGHATVIEQAGHRRRCPNCGLHQFPRTDPAVTMLVQNGDHALLSRRHGAPPNRWSALAGFLEPGETPEQAVIREAKEETGVEVAAVEYVTSQPWPFPYALMIGFWAFVDPADDATPSPEPGELTEARWFDREELTRALRDEQIALPPPGTIGNYLISTWLAGPDNT